MKQKFLFILFVLLVYFTAGINAQISDSLYNSLPAYAKPVNKNTVTLQQKASIIEGVTSELNLRFSKELNGFRSEVEKEMLATHDKYTRIEYAYSIARFYLMSNDYKRSFEFFKKANAYAHNDTVNKKRIVQTYSILASLYAFYNNRDSAMTYLAKALDIGDQKDSAFLCDIYGTYASIYGGLNLYSQAIYYDKKFVETMPEVNKRQGDDIATLVDIASYYAVLFRDTANKGYDDSSKTIVVKLVQRTKGAAAYWYNSCYFILGLLDEFKGFYKDAIAYYDSSLLPAYTNKGVYPLTTFAMAHRAICRLKLYNNSDAATVLDTISIGATDFVMQQMRSQALYQFANKKGDWKKALKYYEDYVRYKDSINVIAGRAKVFEANQKYSVKQKEADIAELQNKNLQEKNAKRGWLIIALLAVVILFILYLHYRQRLAKREGAVQELNNKLQHIEAEMTLKQMQQIAASEQALIDQRVNISRDMHDEISGSVALLKLLISDMLANAKTTEAKSMLANLGGEVSDVYVQVREFMHRLYKNNAVPEFNVADFLQTLPLTFGAGSSLRIRTEFDREKTVHYFTPKQHTETYLFIKEAVSNCIKHSTASSLFIKLDFREDNVYIDISDNGKGMVNITPGIGMQSMRERIKALGGEVKFVTAAGLQITSTFPVN